MSRPTLIILATAMLAMATPCLGGSYTWEPVSTLVVNDIPADGVDVSTRDGYIYVVTERATTVKVMSIVGQLISQQNIPAGTCRLKVTARGIYILKIGTVTRRVTI